jgi:crotonobetainyl-CoA:carnitine CoA-transferase CaiB-like acyl-CoA transferase
MPQPLDGMRVLDLSRLLPGPACTWYLQGLGADVIKVEDPEVGDYLRYLPPVAPDGTGAWFSALNAGKRSVALDLRLPGHRSALETLIGEADVLVESFRPGVMARLGFDPTRLRARWPRLVVASISGYGQDGPWAHVPGHDVGYVGLAGVLWLGTRHEGAPDVPPVQVADMGGALTAALAIVAALVGRERTGEGDWIDLSMTEAALAFVAGPVAQAACGSPPEPGGEPLTGGLASYGVYRCADGGLLALGALEAKFWDRFTAAAGDGVERDRRTLAALFATRPRDEWVALLADACVAPVLALDELQGHEQHRARRALVGEGPGVRVRPPFAGADALAALPAPRLGEHTAEVLRAAGVDPAAIEGAPS